MRFVYPARLRPTGTDEVVVSFRALPDRFASGTDAAFDTAEIRWLLSELSSPSEFTLTAQRPTDMDTSPETAQKVESLFREHLERNFQGALKFDPIRVEPTLDQYGEDTFHVTVVYDGDQKLLDYAKLNAITVEVWGQLRALGINKIPIESYVDKKEDLMRDELLAPEPWEVE